MGAPTGLRSTPPQNSPLVIQTLKKNALAHGRAGVLPGEPERRGSTPRPVAAPRGASCATSGEHEALRASNPPPRAGPARGERGWGARGAPQGTSPSWDVRATSRRAKRVQLRRAGTLWRHARRHRTAARLAHTHNVAAQGERVPPRGESPSSCSCTWIERWRWPREVERARLRREE